MSTLSSARNASGDVARLRAKIVEMSNRIQQLEDALSIFQAGVSSEPHPLLRGELLGIKFAPEKDCLSSKGEPGDDTSDTIDAFGILTIGDQGAKYFGPSAGTEVCPLSTEICPSL